jgi:cobalt-zinc-cadmium efflux system membrane fusion protein
MNAIVSSSTSTRRKIIRTAVPVGIAVVLLVVAMLGFRRFFGGKFLPLRAANASAKSARALSVELVPGTVDSLRVQPEAAAQLGIKVAPARAANLAETLRLPGTLTLDAGRLEQVRSRFAGEVVEIGKTADGSRPVQFGDRAARGQLLTVVWSRELGEKKSELVDALSQFHLDSQTLTRLRRLYQDAAIPERQIRDAERAVDADRIAISRVRRTLQSWRVGEEEITAIEAEAKKLIEAEKTPSGEFVDRWARVELRAALDGVILERNVAVGDIVSPQDDLFEVADLSRFRVLAYAYEEDLPRLDALAEDNRSWTVKVQADPAGPSYAGKIEQVGRVIDPTQHTAMVMGWVDDPAGRLRAGQFILATVALPPPGNEVVVPASALIEKGGEKLLFVKTAERPIFAARRVSFSRQVGDTVCIHIVPPQSSALRVASGLKPNEEVVTSGVVALQQALTDLVASKSAKAVDR